MNVHIGSVFPARFEHARIGDYRSVGSAFVKKTQIFAQLGKIVVDSEYVDRDVQFPARGVRVFHRLRHFLFAEIGSRRPQTESAASDVNGVRAEMQRRLQLRHIARGSEQFGPYHSLRHTATPSPTSYIFESNSAGSDIFATKARILFTIVLCLCGG